MANVFFFVRFPRIILHTFMYLLKRVQFLFFVEVVCEILTRESGVEGKELLFIIIVGL